MSESEPRAVTPDEGARATRFAYVSLGCALLGLVWLIGGPNFLLLLPCVALSVLAIVFGAKSLRRTQGRPRVASITGVIVGSIGAALEGICIIMLLPFLVWIFSGSS